MTAATITMAENKRNMLGTLIFPDSTAFDKKLLKNSHGCFIFRSAAPMTAAKKTAKAHDSQHRRSARKKAGAGRCAALF